MSAIFCFAFFFVRDIYYKHFKSIANPRARLVSFCRNQNGVQGVKYIFRSDIMFKKEGAKQQEEEEEEARRMAVEERNTIPPRDTETKSWGFVQAVRSALRL